MSIYTNVKDTTMQQPAHGPGMAYRKACSACNQHKEIRGGSLYTRLKLWRCAACTEAAKK
jgi:hypothetical protein